MTMKIRRSVFWFTVIMVALVVAVIWFGEKKPVKTPSATSTATNATAPPATPAPNAPVTSAPANTNTPMASAVTATATPKPPVESKEQQMAEILSSANDVPIVFYGRLEDQFGNPVAGAEITGTTTIISGKAVGANRVSATSDGNGFFQLNAGNGQSLGIMPQKAGYALATTGTEFNYSHLNESYYVPDPNNPTVIKMWKLQGAESLVSIDQHYKLHYTDAPMNFDLLTGKIIPAGGDIKITVTRPSGILSGRSRQDWSVRVEAVDGGLMDSGGQEAVTYAAPEGGYEPSSTFIFSTNAPYKWFEEFNQGFFLMSRNGQVYSKLGLSFRINRTPDDFMYVTFGGIANTNGSRNWEGDPNTMKATGQ